MVLWYDIYLKEAQNPDWEIFDAEAMHVHDWRSYITDEVREMWFNIPLIGRCAVIACCENVASNEEWN